MDPKRGNTDPICEELRFLSDTRVRYEVYDATISHLAYH